MFLSNEFTTLSGPALWSFVRDYGCLHDTPRHLKPIMGKGRLLIIFVDGSSAWARTDGKRAEFCRTPNETLTLLAPPEVSEVEKIKTIFLKELTKLWQKTRRLTAMTGFAIDFLLSDNYNMLHEVSDSNQMRRGFSYD